MNYFVKKLNQKISKRCLKIGIIGIGYVGIKLVLAFSKSAEILFKTLVWLKDLYMFLTLIIMQEDFE